MGLYVETSYVIEDGGERWHGGEEPLTETVHETPGAVFRAAAGRDRSRPWEAMGRCVGKVYVGEGRPVGWVFVSRQRYEDTGKPYLREAWVTVHTAPPTVTRTYHYADL